MNITEFDNDRTPRIEIVATTFCGLFLVGVVGLFIAGALVESNNGPAALMWSLLGGTAACLFAAIACCVWSIWAGEKSAPKRAQSQAREDAKKRLDEEYNIDVPYSAIWALHKVYIDHGRHFYRGTLAKFDGVDPRNDAPLRYAARLGKTGDIEILERTLAQDNPWVPFRPVSK
jgi:hypothetical protein